MSPFIENYLQQEPETPPVSIPPMAIQRMDLTRHHSTCLIMIYYHEASSISVDNIVNLYICSA
jgi:hypothetical protein